MHNWATFPWPKSEMPRRFLKRYMPSPERIKESKSLRFMGSMLHDPNLWHLNRHSVARAMAIGLFVSMLPLPMQMLISASVAMPARANLPISVGLVWLTNPVTMPMIFFAEYKVGTLLLGAPNFVISTHERSILDDASEQTVVTVFVESGQRLLRVFSEWSRETRLFLCVPAEFHK